MRTAACALLVLVSGVALGAEVYRTVDAAGNITYSDRPEGLNSELVYVATPRPSASRAAATAAPAAGAPANAAAANAAAPQATPPAELTPSDGPTLDELREQRAKNCEIARERVERYAVSHRLYRELPNGEREFLSDAEIDEARARAAADVETWCD